MSKKNLKILVTGGGTAGHIFPIIAVVKELQKLSPGIDIRYIGQKGGKDKKFILGELPKLKVYEIDAEKLSRDWQWRTLLLPYKVLSGFLQSKKILKDFAPDLVFAKGGYVSYPVALAAKSLKIPVILHETDKNLGLANRMIANNAVKIASGFKSNSKKSVWTGNPIREEFWKVKSSENAKLPIITVIGGSQGAHAINSLIWEIAPRIVDKFQLIHITGENDFKEANKNLKHPNYKPIAFTKDIAEILAKSSLIISRSGGTIFEIAALGKPVILIPLPTAANDHQRANAHELKKAHAAIFLEQVDLTPEKLLKEIEFLMKNKNERQLLGKNIKKFARPDSAAQVAKLIIDTATQGDK